MRSGVRAQSVRRGIAARAVSYKHSLYYLNFFLLLESSHSFRCQMAVEGKHLVQAAEDAMMAEMAEVKAGMERRHKREKRKRLEQKKKARVRAAQAVLGKCPVRPDVPPAAPTLTSPHLVLHPPGCTSTFLVVPTGWQSPISRIFGTPPSVGRLATHCGL